MPRLRLVTDEPELDPPAPLPISAWRGTMTTDAPVLDAVAEVERALGNAQRSMDTLTLLAAEHDAAPLRFPGRRTDDDDGPWAA